MRFRRLKAWGQDRGNPVVASAALILVGWWCSATHPSASTQQMALPRSTCPRLQANRGAIGALSHDHRRRARRGGAPARTLREDRSISPRACNRKTDHHHGPLVIRCVTRAARLVGGSGFGLARGRGYPQQYLATLRQPLIKDLDATGGSTRPMSGICCRWKVPGAQLQCFSAPSSRGSLTVDYTSLASDNAVLLHHAPFGDTLSIL